PGCLGRQVKETFADVLLVCRQAVMQQSHGVLRYKTRICPKAVKLLFRLLSPGILEAGNGKQTAGGQRGTVAAEAVEF
ncbi:MAG: hypothetical protein AB1374_06820, partial [Bacillota bacterium]